jgi:ribosomal protein S18 acetylase RimI-like enzyme
MHIRSATPDDDAALVELELAGWSDDGGFPSVRQRMTEHRRFFKDGQPTQDTLVAVDDDGRVVGYVTLAQAIPVPEAAHAWSIHGVGVHPDARRQGVARSLLAEAEAEARRRGATRLGLGVFSTNAGARALYEAAGYEVETIRRGLFRIGGRDVDDIEMVRWL